MAQRSGCELVSARQIGGELVGEFMCPDVEEGKPLATATLLQDLTDTDDAATFDPSVVWSIRSARGLGPAIAHRYIQEHVEFRPEKVETFARPAATLRAGYGDCDDSARALVGLARASGIRARLVFFLLDDGTPVHVTAELFSRGAWRWAETTIPARFGEHPFDAMARLGKKRPDMDGVAVVLGDDGTTRPARSIGAMDQQVARVGTPVSAQALADALAAAWPTSVGGSPGSAIQVLVAQSAFETGRWAAVWNWNLGNVKYSGGTDWFTMTASEGSGASTTMVASKWRSYPTLEAGAAAWLSFLAANYATALTYAEQGDVADFVAALKSSGYFTGDQSQYATGVQQYYSQFSSIVPVAAAGSVAGAIDSWAAPDEGEVTQTSAAAIVGGAGFLGAVVAWVLL
jgi:hypothetical protein